MARCTIARLMKAMGQAGVLRGKKVRTTVSRKDVAASDRVNRQFVAERPNQVWVTDFTYVSTWQGFAYVAFIIDVVAVAVVSPAFSSTLGHRPHTSTFAWIIIFNITLMSMVTVVTENGYFQSNSKVAVALPEPNSLTPPTGAHKSQERGN